MLSFLTFCKCYHFCVIIFPCTAWVLSFMLSFNVIIFCYHFPPFFFFLKTWHTPYLYKSTPTASSPPLPSISWYSHKAGFFFLKTWTSSGPLYLVNLPPGCNSLKYTVRDTHQETGDPARLPAAACWAMGTKELKYGEEKNILYWAN
jgi:hypothetical protein